MKYSDNCVDGVWSTMNFGCVMSEEESLTNLFTMLITLRCTLTQSVLLGFICGDRYTRLNAKLPESKQGGALNTAGRRVSCTNKRRLRITRNNQLWQIRYITRVAKTKKNNSGGLADGIRQRTGRDNFDRYHSWRDLITLLDLYVSSPHCLPINRHITQ